MVLAMQMYLILLLFMCLKGYSSSRVSADDGCVSQQHLELGKRGTVSCYFSAGFYGVFWYSSTSYETDRPFLYYKDGQKTGRGYTSGEFDIHQNGSLVINNVSLEHDHFFTAAHIKRIEGIPVAHEVRVVVTVKPMEDRPLIKQCKQSSQNDVCYIQSNGTFDLTCYVGDSRPRIPLKWVKRPLVMEKNIPFEAYYSPNGIMESSFANTTYTFNNSECLILLVCKTAEDTPIMTTQESLVLAECSQTCNSSTKPQTRYVEIYSSVTLECTHAFSLLVVWKRHQENGEYTMVDFSVNNVDNTSNTYNSYYPMSHGNSMLIEDTSYKVEGLYSCTFSNGTNWGCAVFNVTVHAQRSSVTLRIEGCEVSGKCEIEAHEEGSLTCKILGVHPIVGLEWVILTDNPSEGISLFNESVNIARQADVYDIALTVRYVIKDTERERISVKCTVSGPHSHIFSLDRAADLVVSQEISTKAAEDQSRKSVIVIVVTVGLLVLVVEVIVLTVFCARRKALQAPRENQQSNPEEEMETMLPQKRNNEDLLKIMKTSLRGKYRTLYTNSSPSLNHLEAAYSVETIFIRCPIAFLRPPTVSRNKDTWETLESYNDIFRKDKFRSSRCFIKAYPGYGKTTLALKLAYDWSENEEDSLVKDEDLFIFLHMNQLAIFPNIYQAIRRTLLPKDSPINDIDIKNILQNCNSLTIFLDDFEEYPDKLKFSSSDVLSIIKGEMFQNHKVIVTTRSFNLMKDYNITGDKVRLIGFDHSARKTYVDQVFQNESSDNSKILEQLEKNPALRELFEIPLFFTAFVHMPREHAHFQELDNITKVVSYLMECFEKHAQVRCSEKQPVPDRAMDRSEYRKLDKIAFESLAMESNKEWLKSDICKRTSEKFYKKCIKTGILIQDERFIVCDNPYNREHGNSAYETMVRFHHKILCEWHAAYYVVKQIKQGRTAVLRKTLNKLDPFNCELIYLFACGLYPEGTSKITALLKEQSETHTLVMRCMYEQNKDFCDMEDSLKKMCEDPVIFYNEESRLKQTSTLKLLDICSDNKINIKAVWCYSCIEYDKCTDQYLALESGATIPKLDTLKELLLHSHGLKITQKNAESVLKYAGNCSSVETLIILGHFMPLTFTEDELCHKLIERNVIVTWEPVSDREYILDLVSKKWKDTKGKIVEEQRHQVLEKEFCEFWNLGTEND